MERSGLVLASQPLCSRKYGKTPLFYGGSDDAELLVGSGADPNAHDNEGLSPLFWELWISKWSFYNDEQKGGKAVTLIMLGADIHERLAHDLVTDQYKGVGPDGNPGRLTYYKGSRPLHLAASKGIIPVMKLLIAKGADVNARDAAGQTPISLAAPRYKPLLQNAGAKE